MTFWSLAYWLKPGLVRMSNSKMFCSLEKLTRDKAETLLSWLCALARCQRRGSPSHTLRWILRMSNWQPVGLTSTLSLSWRISTADSSPPGLSVNIVNSLSVNIVNSTPILCSSEKQLGRTTSLRTDPCFGGRKSHCVGTRSSRGKVRGLKLGTSLCL